MEEQKLKYTYFQFNKKNKLPVYLRCIVENFDPELIGLFAGMNFEELNIEEAKDIEDNFEKTGFKGKLLTIDEATPVVARQIAQASESDRFGPESIIPKEGYRVYRFHGICIMVYSFGVSEWKMGCFKDFGHPDDIFACRSVVNRFISWTLSSLGIVGFWGVPVDEGVVVMKQIESAAEAVYIDINERKLYSIDGERKIDSRFSILRLDSGLKDKNIRMTPEQMMSFLFHHCTFLDYSGPSTPVRQVIQYLSKNIEGQIFPKESFRPRSDLSL